MDPILVALLAIGMGALARMLIPWLIKLYRKQTAWQDWEWKYLRGQLIGLLIFGLALPFFVRDLPELLRGVDWYTAWMAGWTSADIGRLIDKEISA